MLRLADEVFDEFIDRGECEFVHDYALPFTLLVVADLLGVPEDDRDEFRTPAHATRSRSRPRRWSTSRSSSSTSSSPRTSRTVGAQPRDDVMTGLASATFPDGTLPPVHDVDADRRQPVQRGRRDDRPADVDVAPHPRRPARPAGRAPRRPDADPRLHGGGAAAGAADQGRVPAVDGRGDGRGRGARRRAPACSCSTRAANRDPRQFDDPLEFKLDRANGRQHIGFGHGIHSCAGAPLARAETKITIEKFLARTDDIRISEAHHGPAGRAPLRVRPDLHAPRSARAASSSSRPPTDDGGRLMAIYNHTGQVVTDLERSKALLPGGLRVRVLVRDPAARRGDRRSSTASNHRSGSPRRTSSSTASCSSSWPTAQPARSTVPAARDERPRAHAPVDLGRRRARRGGEGRRARRRRSSRRATSGSRCSSATPTASSSSSSPPTTATASHPSPSAPDTCETGGSSAEHVRPSDASSWAGSVSE